LLQRATEPFARGAARVTTRRPVGRGGISSGRGCGIPMRSTDAHRGPLLSARRSLAAACTRAYRVPEWSLALARC